MGEMVQTFGDGVRVEWRWAPEFVPDEFRCKGTGNLLICPRFMDRLLGLRQACGFPFIISSGYRTPSYNSQVSSTGLSGPHTGGRLPDLPPEDVERGAVDIKVYGHRAHEVIRLAQTFGFSGLGVSQKGPHQSRFIHLDNLPDAPGQPRSWAWSY